jgi:hypothetical protein
MTLTLESVLVGVVVFGCALFSVWQLMSVRLRLKVLEGLSGLPSYSGGGLAKRLRRRALAGLSAGCGSCAGAAAHGVEPDGVKANVQLLNRRSAAPRR